jgi:hypothetical protein
MALIENYTFVMNVAALTDETYELAPGHVLRRATHEEIEEIRRELERLGGVRGPFLIGMLLWEGRLPLLERTIERAPESEWRYYVLSFRGNNAVVEELEMAANLSPIELEFGFTLISAVPGARGLLLNANRLFHVLESAGMDAGFFVNPSHANLEEVRHIHSQLQQDDRELDEIKRIARRVTDLKGFPHRSPLQFLGYFAVLEALLTHNPKPGDPYDSITRQIKKKIALLNNRFESTLDYSPFGNAAPEKIWAKMYEYRSQLAHGGNPEFTGDLSLLGNHEQAFKLLKETVKAVIRQALSEPRLLLDLREC